MDLKKIQKGTLWVQSFALACLLGGGLLSGCGGGSSAIDSSSSTPVRTTIGDLKVGGVSQLSFGNNNQGEVTFEQLTGKEQFILSFFSLSEGGTGDLMATVQGNEARQNSNSLALSSPLFSPPPESQSEDPTGAFHHLLREAEQNLPSYSSLNQNQRQELTVSVQASEAPVVGSQRSIKVLNSLSSTTSYQTITATVAEVTPHYVAYLDNEAIQAGVLNLEDVKKLVDAFEAKSGLLSDTFGFPSDIDQNGKVNIVFSPVLNRLSEGGGIVTGYFFAGDLYSPDVYPTSNQGEFIYCHVPNPGKGDWGPSITKDFYLSNTAPLCLPHELQHAINYNMKVLVNGGESADPAPFNEGQSHFAEDLYFNFEKVSEENPSRVDLCLRFQGGSFVKGTGLGERGCAYLFYRYLYEQADNGRFIGLFSGKQLIQKLHNTALVGLEAIEKITGETPATLFPDFFSSLYLTGTGLTTDSKYQFKGINLRASQDDNRWTNLNGPAVIEGGVPLSHSVLPMGTVFLKINGKEIIQAGNKLNLEGSGLLTPGATLIRIEDQ